MSTTIKLSQRAAAYTSAAAIILGFGIMITLAAIFYGLVKVSVADGADCGTGFTSSYKNNFNLSDTGDDLCAVAESSREATTHGLLGAGIAGIVVSAIVFGVAGSTKDEKVIPDPPPPASSASPMGPASA